MVSAYHVAMEGLHSMFVSSYIHTTTLLWIISSFARKRRLLSYSKNGILHLSLHHAIIITWRIFDIGILAGKFSSPFFLLFQLNKVHCQTQMKWFIYRSWVKFKLTQHISLAVGGSSTSVCLRFNILTCNFAENSLDRTDIKVIS